MERFFYRILGTLLLLSAFGSGVAAETQTNDGVSGPSKSGSISGLVVNEKGQPLAGANVSVQSRHGPQTYRNAITDNEGRFHVAGLDPVLYSVAAHYPTYVFQPDLTRQPSTYRVGDSVTITLIKGGVITGTVTSASGDPLVQIRVNAILVHDVNGRRYGTTRGERFTDDRGVYRVYGLPPGKYLVSAGGGNSVNYSRDGTAYDTDAPTYAPSSTPDTAVEISVLSGEETTGVDIRYRAEQGYVISGTVKGTYELKTDSYSRVMLSPVSKALHLLNVDAQHVQPNSDSKGFSFPNVANGDYELIATSTDGRPEPADVAMSDPKRITVRGADVTGLELITRPLGSISGRLVLESSTEPTCKDKQKPLLTETLVSTSNLKESLSGQLLAHLTYFRQVSPDKAGDFSFSYLTSGQYGFDVQSFARHWYLRAVTYLPPVTQTATKESIPAIDVPGKWLTLKAGDRLKGLSITLAEGAAVLRGTVTTSEDQKLPARLMVHLVPAEPNKGDEVLRYYAYKVEEDGSFTIANIAPGRYWAITRIASQEALDSPNLRRPDQIEVRRKLRQEAEANNQVIELTPCQNLTGLKLKM